MIKDFLIRLRFLFFLPFIIAILIFLWVVQSIYGNDFLDDNDDDWRY